MKQSDKLIVMAIDIICWIIAVMILAVPYCFGARIAEMLFHTWYPITYGQSLFGTIIVVLVLEIWSKDE